MDNLITSPLKKEIAVWAKSRAAAELDTCMLFCGEPGAGKSTLAANACKLYDPDFNLSKCAWTPEQLLNVCEAAPPYSAILWDESDYGTNNKQQMTRTNLDIYRLFETIRYKGLYLAICKPTFWEFSRYFAVTRSILLIMSTYRIMRNGDDLPRYDKGYYYVYNRQQKLLLWEWRLKSFKAMPKYSYSGLCRFDAAHHWFFNEDGGKAAYNKAKMDGLAKNLPSPTRPPAGDIPSTGSEYPSVASQLMRRA